MMYRDGAIRCYLDIQRLAALNTGIRPNYIYGLLYNWYAAADSRIGNSGFTVPTDAEYAAMTNYVNTTRNIAPNDFGVGNHLKSCRQVSSPIGGDCATTVHPRWNSDATNYGRDTLKFGGLPAGQRSHLGPFDNVGSRFWINSNESSLVNVNNNIVRFAFSSTNTLSSGVVEKKRGNSIRLSRLATPTELLIPEGQIIPNYYKGNNDFLYDCVRINDRIWTAQNLAETKWSDGTLIPFAGVNGVNYSDAEWAALTTPAQCAYNNNLNYAYSIGTHSYLLGGKTFFYNEVTNPITGRVWMDRNLGANGPAAAVNDDLAYGDLYQWGRLADGHQSRESFTTGVQSTGDIPGHGDFITNTVSPFDWRTPQNNNLWQGVDAINSVAPAGWRLPTQAELQEESATWGANTVTAAYQSILKHPAGGFRSNTGIIANVGDRLYLWSSDVTTTASLAIRTGSVATEFGRVFGFSVRLIKNI